MGKYGLLIDYQYCSGCHSCELACRNEHGLGLGEWGIKLAEVPPFEVAPDDWEWDYIPVPTKLCDLCEDKVSQGLPPACVQVCLCSSLEYGSIDELAKSAQEKDCKVAIFMP